MSMSHRVLTVLAAWAVLVGSSAAQGVSAKPRLPDGFLAQGPMRVTVIWAPSPSEPAGLKEEAVLSLLTADKLSYHSDLINQTRVFEAKHKYIKSVVSKEQKLQWDFDPRKQQFTGKVLIPDGIEIRPAKYSKEEEARYLFFYLGHSQNRVDEALLNGDPNMSKVLREEFAGGAKYLANKGFASNLVSLYEELTPYMDAQLDVQKRRKAVLDEAMEKASKLNRREIAAEYQRNLEVGMGNLLAALSSIPTTSYTVNRFGFGGWFHQSFGARNVSGIYSGINRAAQAKLKFALLQSELEVSRKYLAKETGAQLEALQSDMDNRRKELTKKVRQLGVTQFSLPETTFTDEEEILGFWKTARDYRTLITVLGQKYREQQAAGGKEFPFRTLEMAWLKSAMPNSDTKKRSEETFGLAKDCVAAANLVPEDAYYDNHRAEALRFAADLALQAVNIDVVKKSWAGAHNPKAAYALYWIEMAENLGGLDIGGERREAKFAALLFAGHREEALQLGLEIQEIRKSSPLFNYQMAALYATAKPPKTNEALQAIDDAIRAGFKDLKGARENPDFAYLKYQPRFKSLTNILVEYRQSGDTGGPSTGVSSIRKTPVRPSVAALAPATAMGITIKNRSAFALTNVTLRLEPLKGNGAALQHRVDRDVAPDETYLWDRAIPDSRLAYRIYLECDQGKDKYP